MVVAWFHGSLFFLLGGTRGRHLVFYLVLAALTGLAAQMLAIQFRMPAILSVGDCNVLAVSLGCWFGFIVTRRRHPERSQHTRA